MPIPPSPHDPPLVFEIPARFALYLRYRVAGICADAKLGKLDTIAPHMLSPDGLPVTITFAATPLTP